MHSAAAAVLMEAAPLAVEEEVAAAEVVEAAEVVVAVEALVAAALEALVLALEAETLEVGSPRTLVACSLCRICSSTGLLRLMGVLFVALCSHSVTPRCRLCHRCRRRRHCRRW